MADRPDPAAIMSKAHDLRETIRRAVKAIRYHHAVGESAPAWILGMEARTWEAVLRRLHKR
jgi:hypothetical protein